MKIIIAVFVLLISFVGYAAEKSAALGLSAGDKEKIINAHNEVSKLADKALLAKNARAEFEKILPIVKKIDGVEGANFDGRNFSVKFLNGGSEFWSITETEDGRQLN